MYKSQSLYYLFDSNQLLVNGSQSYNVYHQIQMFKLSSKGDWPRKNFSTFAQKFYSVVEQWVYVWCDSEKTTASYKYDAMTYVV